MRGHLGRTEGTSKAKDYSDTCNRLVPTIIVLPTLLFILFGHRQLNASGIDALPCPITWDVAMVTTAEIYAHAVQQNQIAAQGQYLEAIKIRTAIQ
jgi:hypothetical protein